MPVRFQPSHGRRSTRSLTAPHSVLLSSMPRHRFQERLSTLPARATCCRAGTHTLWVTFNPAHFMGGAPVQAAISITVSKATPDIAWPTPLDIASGSALDDTHLNATTSVPGEFVYHPAAGEVLAVGIHSLSVTFTPADSANYIHGRSLRARFPSPSRRPPSNGRSPIRSSLVRTLGPHSSTPRHRSRGIRLPSWRGRGARVQERIRSPSR